MIFAYLLVQGCNGCTYNGIPQLEKSINSLRAYLPDSKIYVYYGYDETSKDKVPDIETFISSKNLIGVNIGHLKHNFPIIGMKYVAETINNPYRFNILIEKIYVLLNHDEKEEVMYVDVDTIFKPQIRNFRVTNDNAIFYDKGSKLLIQRNLDNFFKQLNYPVRSDSCMYNTGFIYVPANKRKAIAQEALDLVLLMNTISDTQRFAKDLDEQISLSIIIQKHYPNKIKVMTNFMQNNMGQHIKKK